MIEQLSKTERLAYGSKLQRFLDNPWSYGKAFIIRKLIYPLTKWEIVEKKKLFFGKDMFIALPASTDIYLTGGKSHDSELRLAKFLILELETKSCFMDIGAHYGYFTLLAHSIMKGKGHVISFEPSAASFKLLARNTWDLNGVKAYPLAVSDSSEDLVFYEFPNLQSEYNTSDLSQFEKTTWYDPNMAQKKVIKATTIDLILAEENLHPDIIKIDVEGAEPAVLKGGGSFMSVHSPLVIMEYVSPSRSNENHIQAVIYMKSLGYSTFVINQEGRLEPIDYLDQYLSNAHLESDNVVFKKL